MNIPGIWARDVLLDYWESRGRGGCLPSGRRAEALTGQSVDGCSDQTASSYRTRWGCSKLAPSVCLANSSFRLWLTISPVALILSPVFYTLAILQYIRISYLLPFIHMVIIPVEVGFPMWVVSASFRNRVLQSIQLHMKATCWAGSIWRQAYHQTHRSPLAQSSHPMVSAWCRSQPR